MAKLLQQSLDSKQEAESIEFKEGFEPNLDADWCELLKDIFAMVNSGGGIILFGVRNSGDPSDRSLCALSELDPAKITDKVAAYTGIQYSAFEMAHETRAGQPVIALCLDAIPLMLIPHRPGSYAKDATHQTTAFSRGVVYFRHGAKSEPGNAFDVEAFINRRLRQIRKTWLSGVRKVVSAPVGSVVSVMVGPPAEPKLTLERQFAESGGQERDVRVSVDGSAPAVRLTTDPSAPAYRLVTPDETHPHRTMEFLALVNKMLSPFRVKATQHDLKILCSQVGPEVAIGFCHHPRHGPKQYSDEFASWIADNVAKDHLFLSMARARFRREDRQGSIR